MFRQLLAVVAVCSTSALAAIDDGQVTEIIVEEALTDGQIRATLHVDGSATVVHPTDGLLTCTLYTNNKGSLEIARISRSKGYEVDIAYSAPVTDSECWVDEMALGNEVTP